MMESGLTFRASATVWSLNHYRALFPHSPRGSVSELEGFNLLPVPTLQIDKSRPEKKLSKVT